MADDPTPTPEDQSDATSAADAEAKAKEVAEAGRFLAGEADDNAIFASEEEFIGVSPEYKEHAWDTDAPYSSQDEGPTAEAEAEAAVQKAEAEKLARAPQIGRGGFTVNATHPSERRQPAADYIEKNRAAMDKAAGTKR
jgi:hypothetical protein